MHKYKSGDDVGTLDYWPFDNPASEYRIVQGDPKAYGRIDQGGSGHTTRFGMWRCTAGKFECTEQGDELMTVLSGRCRITHHVSGDVLDLGPGNTLFIQDGSRVTWDVLEEVTKLFFGHKTQGY